MKQETKGNIFCNMTSARYLENVSIQPCMEEDNFAVHIAVFPPTQTLKGMV